MQNVGNNNIEQYLMSKNKTRILKRISVITWMATFAFFAFSIIGYFRTPSQMASPIIPESTIDLIARPYLRVSCILFVCLFTAFLLHKFGKYVVSISLCALTIIFTQYFVELIA